jgi:endo-1,4-beta-D-glucanase Y
MSIKKILTATLVCAAATVAFGQTANYPFPQDVTYAQGYKPTTLTTAKAQSWYTSWKNEALDRTSCTKGIMVKTDDATTVKVEAVGWAMIATAYMGDKDDFDGIYRFYNAHRAQQAGGMMSWMVDCNGPKNNSNDNRGSASDGDLDVAFALVVASWQWGGDYLDSARAVITRCKQLVTQCNGLLVLAAGYNGGAWGGACNYTDISYYTPAFFRVFAEVTNDQDWEKLADDTYTHLERGANATTGLVPDWQMVSGSGTVPDGRKMIYEYDACRVPWRITLDYLWNGNQNAKTWATKISTWANGKLSSNDLKNGHNLDGSGVGGNAEMAFLGGWAVSAMANTQTIANAFGTALASRNDSYWYHRHTGNMYLLTLTGNMWKEDMLAGDGYRLTVSITGSGKVGRNPDKTRYDAGTVVTLTAEPGLGFVFDGWSGEGITPSKQTSINVTMNAAKTVSAKFVLSADGTNLVKNGDFSKGSDGMEDWTVNKNGNSAATTTTSNGAVTINITKLPDDLEKPWDLQLVQAGLPLLNGNKYLITFEASAAAPRKIQLMSQQAVSPWDGYLYEDVELTTTKQEFKFTLDMTDFDDDPGARIGFNLGYSTQNVTIGNVSVILLQTDAIYDYRVPQANVKKSSLKVTAKKAAINVKFKAKGSGTAELRLYGLKGNLVTKATLRTVAGKSYTYTFNAGKLPNGFYVVSVHSNGSVERSKVIMPK